MIEELEQPTMPSTQGEVISHEDFGAKDEQTGSNEQESLATFGKFKDAQSLLNAYNSLQSEYTKKCQTLASLIKQKEEQATVSTLGDDQENQTLPPQSTQSRLANLPDDEREEVLQKYVLANPNFTEKLLASYFRDLKLPSSPKLMTQDRGSTFVLTDKEKPKTLEEAGKIARDMFNQNKN